jgi:hypothetical protein
VLARGTSKPKETRFEKRKSGGEGFGRHPLRLV